MFRTALCNLPFSVVNVVQKINQLSCSRGYKIACVSFSIILQKIRQSFLSISHLNAFRLIVQEAKFYLHLVLPAINIRKGMF